MTVGVRSPTPTMKMAERSPREMTTEAPVRHKMIPATFPAVRRSRASYSTSIEEDEGREIRKCQKFLFLV